MDCDAESQQVISKPSESWKIVSQIWGKMPSRSRSNRRPRHRDSLVVALAQMMCPKVWVSIHLHMKIVLGFQNSYQSIVLIHTYIVFGETCGSETQAFIGCAGISKSSVLAWLFHWLGCIIYKMNLGLVDHLVNRSGSQIWAAGNVCWKRTSGRCLEARFNLNSILQHPHPIHPYKLSCQGS